METYNLIHSFEELFSSVKLEYCYKLVRTEREVKFGLFIISIIPLTLESCTTGVVIIWKLTCASCCRNWCRSEWHLCWNRTGVRWPLVRPLVAPQRSFARFSQIPSALWKAYRSYRPENNKETIKCHYLNSNSNLAQDAFLNT